jgi:copper(I)-binding protein
VNRALRAATMGVLLLSPVALSACSAGQVTQTATQVRDKTGAQGQVGDISIRQAELQAPSSGGYERGDDAELQVAFVNGGSEADTLVRVEGKGFASAEIAKPASRISSSSSSSSGPADQIEIPARSSVFVGQQNSDYTVTLTGLEDTLNTGQYLQVTFTFEKAGEVTLPVTVANPPKAQERGDAYDFHDKQKANTEG